MKRMALGLFAFGLVFVLGGCHTQAEMNAIMARAKDQMTAPEYVIGEGDSVTIRVLGHEEFAITEQVRPDGKVTFPEHGDITVASKTASGLRSELEQSFKVSLGFSKAPTVYVAVHAFDSKTVTVLGMIRRPGRYPYTGQMRIADLVGRAVGVRYTESAANRSILFREVDGEMKIYQVRLEDFFFKGDFTTNFYVRPGDILFVPRNGFKKVADVITTVFLPVRAFSESIGFANSVTNTFVGGNN